MMPHITQLLKIEPYKILCLWNTGEVRVIDFAPQFLQWQQENDQTALKISAYEVFKCVSLSEAGTLQWINVPVSISFKGQQQEQPLELDPIVLYAQSRSVKEYKLVELEKPLPEQFL